MVPQRSATICPSSFERVAEPFQTPIAWIPHRESCPMGMCIKLSSRLLWVLPAHVWAFGESSERACWHALNWLLRARACLRIEHIHENPRWFASMGCDSKLIRFVANLYFSPYTSCLSLPVAVESRLLSGVRASIAPEILLETCLSNQKQHCVRISDSNRSRNRAETCRDLLKSC